MKFYNDYFNDAMLTLMWQYAETINKNGLDLAKAKERIVNFSKQLVEMYMKYPDIKWEEVKQKALQIGEKVLIFKEDQLYPDHYTIKDLVLMLQGSHCITDFMPIDIKTVDGDRVLLQDIKIEDGKVYFCVLEIGGDDKIWNLNADVFFSEDTTKYVRNMIIKDVRIETIREMLDCGSIEDVIRLYNKMIEDAGDESLLVYRNTREDFDRAGVSKDQWLSAMSGRRYNHVSDEYFSFIGGDKDNLVGFVASEDDLPEDIRERIGAIPEWAAEHPMAIKEVYGSDAYNCLLYLLF